jgi:hypothetical protein
MRTFVIVTTLSLAGFTSHALAGAAIYQVGEAEECPCDTGPLPRVIYGIPPAATPVYRVDQGPSFDAPVTGYAAPRVYLSDPDAYPYVNGRSDGYATSGYAIGYGAPYTFESRRRRHHERVHQRHHHHHDVRAHAPQTQPIAAPTYVGPARMAPVHAAPVALTGAGGMPHARSAGPLAGAPHVHRHAAPMVRSAPPGGGGRR